MASPSHSRSSSLATTAEGPSRFTIGSQPTIVLPQSYADAAFLHVLATKPDTVIPPDKSLRAVLLRSEVISSQANLNDNESAPQSLQSAVEKIVHRAFWDEARESLSDTDPSRQLARLRALYKDLHAALEGLLPKSHPNYVPFSDPISPTPAPLVSARRHLLELISALQERCAPVRDAQLSSIRSLLQSEDTSDLPERIVQAIRQLLELAEVMKKDLPSAVLGAFSDEDLEKEVVQMARVEERRAILEIYGAKGIRDRWKAWLADEDVQGDELDTRWLRRLVMALGADVAISCPLPTPSGAGSEVSEPTNATDESESNAVPPVFALSSSDLFHLQNHIQALVIVAVLRTFVPLHKERDSTQHADGRQDNASESRTFAERVLALLMIEVDETSEDAGTTKLINLADEVLREHRRLQASSSSSITSSSTGSEGAKPPPIDEQTIRYRVDALLKPTNPVFILLRKRLLSTLSESIATALHAGSRDRKDRATRVPGTMHSGRDQEWETKRPRLHFSHPSSANAHPYYEKGHLRRLVEDLVRNGQVHTKGYEDPVITRGIGDILGELADVIEWVRDTWAGYGLGLDGLDVDQHVSEQHTKTQEAKDTEHVMDSSKEASEDS